MTNAAIEKKIIDVSGICTNCNHKDICDFVKNIKSSEDKNFTKCVRDCEIVVYSCDNYKPDIEKVCSDDEMCIYCHQEVL